MPPHRIIHPRIGHSQKVASLSDRAYRTWTTYLWVADDFGVMPFDAAKIQGGNRKLAECSRRAIQSDLDVLIQTGLVLRYEVAAEPYICSPTWQTHQQVKWPRATETHWPPPTPDVLAQCDAATQELFKKHPAFATGTPTSGGSSSSESGVDGSEVPRGTSQRSEVLRGTSKLTRAGTRETLSLTPNADADAREGSGEGLPPLDVWLRELQAGYDPEGVTSGYATESAFVDVFANDPRPPRIVFDEMLAHLANHRSGYRWRVKRMVPRLVNWLKDGLWQQLHDEVPPTAIVSEKNLHTLAAGEAFVKGGPNGTH